MDNANYPQSPTEPQRVDPPLAADERTMLNSWLDWHRATVRLKCSGLPSGLSAFAPLPTSPLTTVGGLVSHLRWVEHQWFEEIMLGLATDTPFTKEDPDAEMRLGAELPLEQLLDEYEAQCQRSREITAGLELDSHSRENPRFEGGPRPTTLRWVLVHMIEETARHNGHLDILRELADGSTGE